MGIPKYLGITFCELLLVVDLSTDFHVFLSHIWMFRREVPQLAKVFEALLPVSFRDQSPRCVDDNCSLLAAIYYPKEYSYTYTTASETYILLV